MKYTRRISEVFEILGNLLKFWKKCNSSMVEINECFPEGNTCFSKSIRDFSSQYVFLRKDHVTISWPIRMFKNYQTIIIIIIVFCRGRYEFLIKQYQNLQNVM